MVNGQFWLGAVFCHGQFAECECGMLVYRCATCDEREGFKPIYLHWSDWYGRPCYIKEHRSLGFKVAPKGWLKRVRVYQN